MRLSSLLSVAVGLVAASQVSAQTVSTESMDHRNKSIDLSHKAGQSVDVVDPHSGGLSVRHRDVVLPGNGGMDITVWRTYSSAAMSAGLSASTMLSYRWVTLGPGWSIAAAPRLSATNSYYYSYGGQPSYTRSELKELCEGRALITYYAFLTLELPDGSREPLWSSGGNEARSKNNWKVRCVSDQLSAISPDGVTYDFGNRLSDVHVGLYKMGDPEVAPGPSPPSQSESYMVAKSGVDPHGNRLTYSYQQLGTRLAVNWAPYTGFWPRPNAGSLPHLEKPALLLSGVSADDGRSLTFSYDGSSGRLQSITDNLGRVWSYSHTSAGSDQPQVLATAQLPTGLAWSYEYWPGSYSVAQGENTIPLNIASISAGRLSKLIYPSGGSVQYDYTFYNASVTVGGSVLDSRGERVSRRTLSTGEQWNYSYSRGGTGQYDTTVVAGPEGVTTYKHMGPGYAIWTQAGYPPAQYQNNSWRVGRLMEKTDPTGGVETYSWQPREFLNRYTRVSELGLVHDERVWAADLAQKTITRDGATYTTTYSNYDTYGNPGTIVESGPNGGSRTTTLTYFNDPTKWIVGKTKDETSSLGSVVRNFVSG